MVVNSIEAFVARDMKQAEEIIAKDDEIDSLSWMQEMLLLK